MSKKTSLLAVLPLVFAFSLPVLAVPDPATAGSASAVRHDEKAAVLLAERLQAMNSLHASFSQNSSDKNGRPKVERGEMQLKRPNQFRWQVTAPFNQEIIASEGKLWMLDPDFLQVVIKNQADQTGPTAVQLLSGDAATFLQDYLVAGRASAADAIYTLKPKDDSDLFEQLEIHFSQNQLATITIFDALGGKRRIEFTQVKVNQPIASDLFVPDLKKLQQAGYDIIDESSINERGQ